MNLVLDASVALKWFFRAHADESDTSAAVELLSEFLAGRNSLIQPPHFIAEALAVLAREAHGAIAENLHDLLELSIPVRADEAVYGRAMALSRDLGHHLFDTLYHAVALETPETVLVSADEVYCRKAASWGRIIRLSDWQEVR